MKIRLLSDLHMEGFQYYYEWKGEDVLVLAGDIHTRGQHSDILYEVPQYVQVILVAGNHEYYNGIFEQENQKLRDLADFYPNVHYLQNSGVKIDGVDFFGGTMFSDFGLYGEDTKEQAALMSLRGINDFYSIRRMSGDPSDKTRMWTTDDHIMEHNTFRRELQHWLRMTEGGKRVVVSHFVPSPQAIHARWKDSILNAYFTTNMEQFMGWEGYWLYGHTHDSGDFMVGDTRCIGNPKGYGPENAGGFKDDLVVEI